MSMTEREHNHYFKLMENSPVYKGKGLAAKISGVGVPEHDEPILLKTIDYLDKDVVLKSFFNYSPEKFFQL